MKLCIFSNYINKNRY